MTSKLLFWACLESVLKNCFLFLKMKKKIVWRVVFLTLVFKKWENRF